MGWRRSAFSLKGKMASRVRQEPPCYPGQGSDATMPIPATTPFSSACPAINMDASKDTCLRRARHKRGSRTYPNSGRSRRAASDAVAFPQFCDCPPRCCYGKNGAWIVRPAAVTNAVAGSALSRGVLNTSGQGRACCGSGVSHGVPSITCPRVGKRLRSRDACPGCWAHVHCEYCRPYVSATPRRRPAPLGSRPVRAALPVPAGA